MKIIGIRHITYKKNGNQNEFYNYFVDDTDPANGDKGVCVETFFVPSILHKHLAADGITVGSNVIPYRNQKGYLQNFIALK